MACVQNRPCVHLDRTNDSQSSSTAITAVFRWNWWSFRCTPIAKACGTEQLYDDDEVEFHVLGCRLT